MSVASAHFLVLLGIACGSQKKDCGNLWTLLEWYFKPVGCPSGVLTGSMLAVKVKYWGWDGDY